MPFDFAVDLPHPPFFLNFMLYFRSHFKSLLRNDDRKIFSAEMFSAFNKMHNEYCKRHDCYNVRLLFVKKELLSNTTFE